MLRRVVLAGVAACVLALTLGFSQTANAQTGYCWIDAKTGETPQLGPPGWRGPISDPIQVSFGGHNYAKQPDGTWLDAKTGEQPQLGPPGWRGPISSPKQFSYGGHNYVRVPCPPTAQTSMSGGYLGGELVKNWGRVRSTERLATTDVITNQFTDSADPLGGGIVAGYNFAPWNNNWVIGPFASFDWLHLTINHTFPTGFYLGTTTHWIVNAGAKVGYLVTPDWLLFGLAGAAWVNQDLNIKFAPGLSTKNTTTPGFTLGGGVEYQPASLRPFGMPMSLFAQYQHTWYETANFNTPTPASPAFNYAFKRDDDTIKFGALIYLSR